MIFMSIFFYHWKVVMIHPMYLREVKGFWRNKRFVTIILVVVLLLAVCIPASLSLSKKIWPPCPSEHSGFIHNVHNKLVDEAGCEVQLTGINWFGFETSTFSPHGLWIRNWQSMLDQIKQAGFNTIRLPYSNQLFDASSTPRGIYYPVNPDLRNLSGLALMDHIIQGARSRHLKIILDRHDTSADVRPELWYTDAVSSARWLHDWVMLARHYRGNDTVIGADLSNEPHGPATWGDGVAATDWRLAAQNAGNAILATNPDWLIIVEGIEHYHGDVYWWGGNLEGAEQFPILLSHPDKLVYSAHDYGPGVQKQSWFESPDLAHTLPVVWQKHWAYLQQSGTAPLLLGEFGGRSIGQDIEGEWQRTLLGFLKERGISYTYWSWNPDSGDTGGLLQDDWTTINQQKLKLLKTHQWSLLN
jgi:endoglucanase